MVFSLQSTDITIKDLDGVELIHHDEPYGGHKRMKQRWRWAIALLAFALGIAMAYFSTAPRPFLRETVTLPSDLVATEEPSPAPATLTYEYRDLDGSSAHILTIPSDGAWVVRPVVASTVQSLMSFAAESGAIAAINGGYFDPANAQSTSFVTLDGVVVADPRENTRLMENPDLVPYLPKILNRSEFRRYFCGATWQYAIALHADPVPPACQLVDALGGGPRLLPTNTALEEGFIDVVNGDVVRDSIGSATPNARSAIGITATGDVIWLMAAQRPEVEPPTGMTLAEVAEVLRSLGVVAAMNLDGGSSSGLIYQESQFLGKLSEAGEWIDRPVKSVLVVQSITP